MNKRRRDTLQGYLFISIWLIGFLVFTFYPLLQTIIYSFQDVRFDAGKTVSSNIGFENFSLIFTTDLDFLDKLREFFFEMFLYVGLILVFSFIAAILLNQNLKGRAIFRAIYFCPVIIFSGPIVADLFSEGSVGESFISGYTVIESIENLFPTWLSKPFTSLFNDLIFVLWMSGVQILIYLAGLQKIDRSIYEAARVDGAGPWICFWKITLPSVSSLIGINALYSLISLATFSNNEVLKKIKNDMFSSNSGYGYASAESLIYLVTILFILLIMFGLYQLFKERKEK